MGRAHVRWLRCGHMAKTHAPIPNGRDPVVVTVAAETPENLLKKVASAETKYLQVKYKVTWEVKRTLEWHGIARRLPTKRRRRR